MEKLITFLDYLGLLGLIFGIGACLVVCSKISLFYWSHDFPIENSIFAFCCLIFSYSWFTIRGAKYYDE